MESRICKSRSIKIKNFNISHAHLANSLGPKTYYQRNISYINGTFLILLLNENLYSIKNNCQE